MGEIVIVTRANRQFTFPAKRPAETPPELVEILSAARDLAHRSTSADALVAEILLDPSLEQRFEARFRVMEAPVPIDLMGFQTSILLPQSISI